MVFASVGRGVAHGRGYLRSDGSPTQREKETTLPTLPYLSPGKHVVNSPHVLLLGAGASRAACPKGDATGRVVPVMKDLIDVVGLRPTLARLGVTSGFEDFEAVYDSLVATAADPGGLREIEESIRQYFASLRLPVTSTVYDYSLATLRRKDLIATFNWDPFLAQAFRRNLALRELPRIVFLHGNVAIGYCEKDEVKGWYGTLCEKCMEPLAPTPLFYPVSNKNYSSNPYIATEWGEFKSYLESAYFFTIFGYGAPKTDMAARKVLKENWDRNPHRDLAEVEVIDIKPEAELKASWEVFIVRQHYLTAGTFFESYQMMHPRRSCDALAGATLENDPWKDDRMSECENLYELRARVASLVDEELEEVKSQRGFSRMPYPEQR